MWEHGDMRDLEGHRDLEDHGNLGDLENLEDHGEWDDYEEYMVKNLERWWWKRVRSIRGSKALYRGSGTLDRESRSPPDPRVGLWSGPSMP